MRRFRQLSCFVFALGFYGVFQEFAGAEDPLTAIASNPGRKSGPLGSPKEIAQWQVDIVESSYSLRKSERTLSSLLAAYEQLIAVACMPELPKTLQYRGGTGDPACIKAVEATLALDAENPYATCARDGIDSRSCDDAFAAQSTSVISATVPLWSPEEGGSSDLDLELDKRNLSTPQFLALTSEFSRLANRAGTNAELRAETIPDLKKVSSELLGIACKTAKLKIQSLYVDVGQRPPGDMPTLALENPEFRRYLQGLSPEGRQQAIVQAREQEARSQVKRPSETPASPMDEIMKNLKPAQTEKTRALRVRSDGILRTRFISAECQANISKVQRADPTSAASVCALEGDYNPTCIKAKRREKAQLTKLTTSHKSADPKEQKTSPSKNFSTF